MPLRPPTPPAPTVLFGLMPVQGGMPVQGRAAALITRLRPRPSRGCGRAGRPDEDPPSDDGAVVF